MTDPDATAQAALRTLATRTIDHGWGRAIDHGWGSGQIVTHPTLVLQKAPALAAAAAFIEADRWAGYEREATFGGTFLSDNARNGVLGGGWAQDARALATGRQKELAQMVLALARESGACPLASPDDHAHAGALAQALEMHAPLLRAAVGMDKPIPTDNDAAQEIDPATGRLVWDERLACYLEGLGQEGADTAAKVRAESIDPRQADLLDPVGASLRLWRLWLPFPSVLVDAFEREDVREAARAFTDAPSEAPGPWSGAHGPWKPERETPKAWLRLGWALWFDFVRPTIGRVPAMRSAPFETVHRGIRIGNTTEATDDPRQLSLTNSVHGIVAYLDLRVVRAIRRNSGPELAAALASTAGHRLISMGGGLIAHQLAQGHSTPYQTVLPGRGELKKILNVDADRLTALLDGGRAFTAEGPGWKVGGLFTYTERKAAVGRHAATILNWTPDLFKPKGLLTAIPPYDGARPDIGPRPGGQVIDATWWIYGLMQARSRELAKRGSVAITDADWREMRDATGLSAKSAARLREYEDPEKADRLKWTSGRTRTWVVRTDPGRYRLTDTNAHNFLLEQGGRREQGALHGKRSAEKRAGKLPGRRK